ncbi:hypothetical protein [Acidithiobacillus thiooxidans]|jgi:hypothetical protein|nr:hypothetical protein [Acidithiobacillus thiooxidans]
MNAHEANDLFMWAMLILFCTGWVFALLIGLSADHFLKKGDRK